jgi:signal transduction histidine kinase
LLRNYSEIPLASVDRHKLFQILINLLKNAGQAVRDKSNYQREIAVSLGPCGEQQFTIAVKDNGCGIRPEDLQRIFNHGFTTKRDGHGFGLHGSALAAKEMGGTLLVQSDGIDQGACFTLTLPLSSTSAAPSAPSAEV